MSEVKYKRVLLKLSGEAFAGKKDFGIDTPTLISISQQIKHVIGMGVGVAMVVGGGNIWRGSKAEAEGIDRVTADYAGMLATVINALCACPHSPTTIFLTFNFLAVSMCFKAMRDS